MYFLEDRHPKYEYACYIRVKNATPYVLPLHCDDIIGVYNFINDLEKRHSRYNHHFYIDNNFYDNPYPNGDYSYYYRFLRREVNDWETLRENNNLIKLVK